MATQNRPVQVHEPTDTSAHDEAEPLPFTRLLLFHLGPGAGVMLFILVVTPALIARGLPAQLGFLGGVALVGTPIELGALLYLGKKRNGVLSLRGVVRYTHRMPLWQYVALFLPFVLYGVGLHFLYSPVAPALAQQVFGWLPSYLLPTAPGLGALTAITLVTALLTLALDGAFNPIVEELYFRGFLLPRLARWGWFAPLISALLFALQHYWQPYNYLLIFLLVLPETLVVRWKRNVRFSILCHCFANSLGVVLTLVALLVR
jgi:membrane protease YdiL (CAAX protease family)